MIHSDPLRAPVESLQEEMGKALEDAIARQGGKVAFAKRAGLNRATLYRLLRGENVSTEVLLRTLRTLGRVDLITRLIAPPEPSPLELRPKVKGRRGARKAAAVLTERAHPPTKTKSRSLVAHLTLGRATKEDDDG